MRLNFMNHKLRGWLLLFSILFLIEGCVGAQIVDKSDLSEEEIEKIRTVQTYKANELNESSYKIIKKVKGLSCDKYRVANFWSFAPPKWEVEEKAETEKSIEQAKIYAVRAGGNGLVNMTCQEIQNDPESNCRRSIVCTADAIQAN
jgi:hypothetical protein